MGELSKLVYILRVEDSSQPGGAPRYGAFMIKEKSFNLNDGSGHHVYRQSVGGYNWSETRESLENLAKLINDEFFSHPVTSANFCYEKRDGFPDSGLIPEFDNKLALRKYHNLTPEEISIFEKALVRVLKGEPAKKRYNPEITDADRREVLG